MFLQYEKRNIRARINAGVMLSYSGMLFVTKRKDIYLVLKNKAVKPGWTGLRFGIQLDFPLSGKTKSYSSVF